jgi:CHAD domain-containing protein
MKLKPSRKATETARTVLPKMAEKYFKAGREVAEGTPSPKELHRFRIATKRFRYSLELFRPVYGSSLERQLDALRKLQNILGKLSDYHTMQSMFTNDKSLDAKLQRAANKKLKEFHERWKAFGSPLQLRRWKSYLARGGRPVAASR